LATLAALRGFDRIARFAGDEGLVTTEAETSQISAASSVEAST
jgi:hypothetical protein